MSQQFVYGDDLDLRARVPRDDRRMYVHANVSLPCGEVDPTTLKPLPSYRPNRLQAQRWEQERKQREMEKEKYRNGKYISLRSAVMTIGVTLFVLGIVWISQYGRLTEQQKQLNLMNRSIEQCVAVNEQLEKDIMGASDAAKICYAASQELDMIPSESAYDNTYAVVAVSARPQSREQAMAELQSAAQSAQLARSE